jgi:hypothetical protein
LIIAGDPSLHELVSSHRQKHFSLISGYINKGEAMILECGLYDKIAVIKEILTAS